MLVSRLDPIAKPYTLAPGFTLRFAPYRPVFWVSLYAQFSAYLKELGLPEVKMHESYILATPLITSYEATETLPEWAQGFLMWLESRTGDIVEDWKSFELLVSFETVEAMRKGYDETRSDLPGAPKILQQPMPVPEDEDGNENFISASGGKRSKRK